jgi:hypothetical protein
MPKWAAEAMVAKQSNGPLARAAVYHPDRLQSWQ